MRRCFILGASNFPRGGAAANYVLYLAKALMEDENVQVVVAGNGKNRLEDYSDNKKYVYQGITYINKSTTDTLYKKIVDCDATFLELVANEYQISHDDYVILYEYNYN